jgi:hypothetical protein
MVSIIGEKNLIFDQLYRSIGLRFFFLMTTIDLIDVFCLQSIIGIDPIDVFLTIGAQLWYLAIRCPLRSDRGRKTRKNLRFIKIDNNNDYRSNRPGSTAPVLFRRIVDFSSGGEGHAF